MPAELGLVAESHGVGDLGNALAAARIPKHRVAGEQALVANEFADGGAFGFEQPMKVAQGDTAIIRHGLRRKTRIRDVGADEVFGPVKMRVSDRRVLQSQDTIVGLDGESKQIDQMAPERRLRFLVNVMETFDGEPQHVDEKRAGSARRIELQRRKTFGPGDTRP